MTGYTPQTIRRWKRALAPYARAVAPASAGDSALLVIDMQEHFAAVCGPIIPTVARLARSCRQAGIPVLFTQHGHADPRIDGGMLHTWWEELIVEGTSDHGLIADLDVQPRDRVIPKRRYDAFFGTTLHQTLQQLGVRDLAVAGVMTNLCVETTARSAFVHDYRVRVLMDAVATATETMQIASLVNLAFGFASVQTAADWLAGLSAV